jgi:glycine/D-amino acid oxidase-like deaminating enzyme
MHTAPRPAYDVVVIGAGIIGLSVAWQLARRSRLRIAVLDKGMGVGEGSTGASSAVCRFRYSLDNTVLLARDGIAAYRDWVSFTGLAAPRATFQNDGVLWLLGDDHSWAPAEAARMATFGVRAEVLDTRELRERFPAINPCCRAPDLEYGEDHDCMDAGLAFYEVDGGYMDPVSAAQDLVEACRGAGVDVCFRSPVTGVMLQGGRVTGVSLEGGRQFSAPLVLNTAGPWCHDLYAAAGLALPWDLAPVRIQVLHRDRPAALSGHIPVTVDMPGGIYFRTQNRGQQLIVSSVKEEDEREVVPDPDNFLRVPDAGFEQQKLHALHHRLPALTYQGQLTGYCGLYTMNRDDVHPVIGPTALEGFWVANGFSGHGFKLAPAIGAMLARAISGERAAYDTDVPLSFLAFDRPPIELASKSVLA